MLPFLSFALLSCPILLSSFSILPFISCLLLPFHVSSFLVSCPSLLSYFLSLLHLCIISFLSSPLLSFIHILAPFLISSPLSHFFNSYLFAFFPFLSLCSPFLPFASSALCDMHPMRALFLIPRNPAPRLKSKKW